MNRIAQPEAAQATGKVKLLFEDVRTRLSSVPNLFRVLGTAPAALEGYLHFTGALVRGSFNAKVREKVALAVAESNMCGYCLSAHSFLGGKAGLSAAEIGGARQASAAVDRTDTILELARKVVMRRGEISGADLAMARSSGLTDGEVIETVANVALNIFTNYVNHVARTIVDFPNVAPGVEAEMAGVSRA